MADRIRVVEAEIIARDRTSAGVRSASVNFQHLYSIVRDNWWGIQNLGTAFAGIGATVAGGMAVAGKAVIDFETGMAGVARTTREEGESAAAAIKDVKGLGDELRAIARTSPVELGRLTAIAEEAGALGVARQDISAFTETIVQLVATTNLTDQSATQLARIGAVMGIAASQFGNLGSTILYAGRSTAATESEIVRFAQYLAPVIKAANGTTAQLIAMSAIFPSLGQRADSARTAVSKTISDIGKAMRAGGDDAKIFAAVAGKSVEEYAKIARTNGVDATRLFLEGVNRAGVGSQKVAVAFDKLGIVETRQVQALRAMAAAVDSSVNKNLDLETSEKNLQRVWQENKELTEAYAAVQSTAGAQIQVVKNDIHDMALSLGMELLPFIKYGVALIHDLVEGFMAAPPWLRQTTVGIALVGGGVAAMLGVLALVGPRLILVKGALLEGKLAFQQFARSAGNASAILATTQNSTTASVYKSAFAYGMMSTTQRQAAYDAYQLANAEKVQAVAAAGALRVNQTLRAIQAEVAHIEESRVVILQALTRIQVYQQEAMSAAAAGNFAYARACLAAADAELAVVEAANLEIAASKATVRQLTVELQARNAARTAAIAQAEAEILAAGAASKGAMAMGLFGKALRILAGPVGLVITGLMILVPLLGIMGRKHHEAASAATINAQRQSLVAEALKKQHEGAKNAVRDMILLRIHALLGKNATEAFGYSLLQLYAIASGGADASLMTKFAADMSKANDKGVKGAAELHNELFGLNQALKDQGYSAGGAAKKTDDYTGALDKSKEAAKEARKAQQELKEAYDNINQALLALPDALIAQREASLAVGDAQRAYNKALADSKGNADALKQAENDLRLARLEHADALEAVYDATKHLQRARQMAADKVADAIDGLADANDSLFNAEEKVAELEEDLDKLRNGPTVEELTKATNKLTDANIKLRKSQTKARDAQYMLNYLMAEGASAYDLEEARLNLDEANADVASSTQDVADAQKDLNDLVSPDPAVIAKKERELASARRDVESATRQIAQAEQALADARHDQQADAEYKDAEQELLSARNAVKEATDKIAEAEQALRDARSNKTAQEELTKAEIELEKALLAQAKANVEVQKQMAISRGEMFGAGREAKALADELGKIGGKGMPKKIMDDLANFRTILGKAKADIEVMDDEAGDVASGIADAFGDAADEVGGIKFEPSFTPLEPKGKEAGESWFTGFKRWIAEHIGTYRPLSGWSWGDGFDFSWLTNAWDTFTAEASKSFKKSWDDVMDFGGWIEDNLSLDKDATIQSIKDWWHDSWEDAKETLRQNILDTVAVKDWLLEKLGIDKDASTMDIAAWFVSIFTGVPAAMIKYFAEKFKIGEWLKSPFNRDKSSGDTTTKTAGEGWAKSLVDGFKKWFSDHLSPRALLSAALGGKNEEDSKATSKGWGERIADALVRGFIAWVTGKLNPFTLIRNILAGDEKDTKDAAGGWGERIGKEIVKWILDPIGSLKSMLSDAIGKAFSLLPESMKGPIRSAVDIWNRFISKMAGITIKVPEVKTPFGDFGGWGVDFGYLNKYKVDVTKLAAGGILRSTVFAAGEAGPEAVIPLDRLFDMFNPVLDLVREMKVMDAALMELAQNQSTGTIYNTNVYVETDADPYEISREIMWTHQTRLS